MSTKALQTEFAGPEVSPGFLLWQVSNKWQAKQREALKPHNLTHVQFVLLASLVWASSESPLNQKQLANHTKLDVMMTSQVLRVLEQKGLITRTVETADKRSFLLRPTSAGVKLANQAIKSVEAVDKQFFKTLGKVLPDFVKIMQRLAA